jgi:hypothetical protein
VTILFATTSAESGEPPGSAAGEARPIYSPRGGFFAPAFPRVEASHGCDHSCQTMPQAFVLLAINNGRLVSR